VSDPAAYGELFRRAYAVLHGGMADEGPPVLQRRPDQSLEEFLASSRREALEPLRRALESTSPPAGLEEAHRLLLAAIECALEADAALAAQVRAYGCGDYQTSLEHSQRAADLARRAVELDRSLIAALWRAEEAAPGILASLGLAQVLPRDGGHSPQGSF
jgi:hypothetical protein